MVLAGYGISFAIYLPRLEFLGHIEPSGCRYRFRERVKPEGRLQKERRIQEILSWPPLPFRIELAVV